MEQVQEENGLLKMEYDALLDLQRGAESSLREEKVKGGLLVEDMVHLKEQAAARMNSRNERRSRYLNAPVKIWFLYRTDGLSYVSVRAREATLQKDLQKAARSKVTIDR